MIGISVLLVAFLLWWGWEKAHRRTRKMSAGLHPEITLPHTKEFELYHNALSLCSMKVRVCLSELGIEYESHPIDLIETGSYETLSRHFLAVNPGGTVPVLVHAGHPVYESHEQIRYAAAHAPADRPSLVPEDPALRAEMNAWIDRSSITDDPLNQIAESAGNAVPGLTLPIFATMIEKIPVSEILIGLLFHFDRIRPLMFLVFKARGIHKLPSLGPLRKAMRAARRAMATHLDALETQLAASGGPWILGDEYTLADVSWLVIFERLRQVDAIESFCGGALRPACAAYWERLQKRPAYQEAILGCSHPLIAYGTDRIREAKTEDPTLRAALEGAGA